MMHSRCFLLPVLACSTLLLTGGLNHRAAPSAPPAPSAGVDPLASSGTPGGSEVLEAAARAFAPERVPWMQMTLWQRVDHADLTYEAQGRYLSAPGHRLRLDLKVVVGHAQGELQMISTGTTLCCSSRLDPDAPATVTTVDFARTAEQSATERGARPAGNIAEAAERILQEQGCPGVAPLLRTVRERLRDPHWKKGQWQEHEVIQVAGTWSSESGGPAGIQAALLPQLRECRVYLDARTLWPYRIEWWGSSSPRQQARPLMQVEYREPILNQPLSLDRCAREFALSPPR